MMGYWRPSKHALRVFVSCTIQPPIPAHRALGSQLAALATSRAARAGHLPPSAIEAFVVVARSRPRIDRAKTPCRCEPRRLRTPGTESLSPMTLRLSLSASWFSLNLLPRDQALFAVVANHLPVKSLYSASGAGRGHVCPHLRYRIRVSNS